MKGNKEVERRQGGGGGSCEGPHPTSPPPPRAPGVPGEGSAPPGEPAKARPCPAHGLWNRPSAGEFGREKQAWKEPRTRLALVLEAVLGAETSRESWFAGCSASPLSGGGGGGACPPPLTGRPCSGGRGAGAVLTREEQPGRAENPVRSCLSHRAGDSHNFSSNDRRPTAGKPEASPRRAPLSGKQPLPPSRHHQRVSINKAEWRVSSLP